MTNALWKEVFGVNTEDKAQWNFAGKNYITHSTHKIENFHSNIRPYNSSMMEHWTSWKQPHVSRVLQKRVLGSIKITLNLKCGTQNRMTHKIVINKHRHSLPWNCNLFCGFRCVSNSITVHNTSLCNMQHWAVKLCSCFHFSQNTYITAHATIMPDLFSESSCLYFTYLTSQDVGWSWLSHHLHLLHMEWTQPRRH